jgi:hypothetical protein
LGESEYLGWTFVSRISDSNNKDTSSSLGYSVELSVTHTPRDAIPEADNAVDDGGEVSTTSAAEEPRNVLCDHPLGISFSNEAMEFPPKCSTVSSQA